jgi:hypothetical protein
MHRRLPLVRPALLLLGALGCLGSGLLGPLPPGGRHVLFIGNSLTYFNDLPGTVASLATLGGDTIRVKSVAQPDFAVIDHALGASNAVDVIEGERWDYVILQQGPTPLQLYRDTLVRAAQLLDPAIRAAGARSVQLLVWAPSARPDIYDDVVLSCRVAAEAVGGVVFPVGAAWRAALAEDPQLPLYASDGFHPAPLGTYLAALVIYEEITGNDARTLPATALAAGQTLTVSEATIRLLQRVAHEAASAP